MAAAHLLLSSFSTINKKQAPASRQHFVHCDRCGKEVVLPADSKITEDWILFCKECEAEIGPIVEGR